MKYKSIDTVYRVETPESIDLEAQLAGPVPRVLAYSIDIAIRSLIVFAASIILMLFGRAGVGLLLLISFLLEWFYPVYYEVFRDGQTPGKRKLNLVVVNDDLTPISWSVSMTRNLLRAVDFLPFAYLFGLVSISLSKKFQRLGDIAAGSIVVHKPKLQVNENLPNVNPVSAPLTLELEDQVALIDFTRRFEEISQDRQEELAAILSDITHREPKAAVSYLQGIGAWLLGKKR